MNISEIKFIFMTFGILMIILSGCKRNFENENLDNNSNTVVEHTFKYVTDTSDWKCDNIEYDLICYPNSWTKINQDKIFFLTYIDENDRNTFLSICKYSLDTCEFDADKYLRIFYEGVIADSIEKVSSYSVTKLEFREQFSYYCELDLTKDNKRYKSMTMIFSVRNLLYDISLKGYLSDYETNKIIFQTILYKFKSSDASIFSPEDPLKLIKEIDMSKF